MLDRKAAVAAGQEKNEPPESGPLCLVPGTGVEPALSIIPTWPSTMRVCQFRHPGWVGTQILTASPLASMNQSRIVGIDLAVEVQTARKHGRC